MKIVAKGPVRTDQSTWFCDVYGEKIKISKLELNQISRNKGQNWMGDSP